MIVVDNVFSNPNEITELAKKQKFYSIEEHPIDSNTQIMWDGKKTENLKQLFSPPLYENIIEQIISKLDFYVDITSTVSMFHSFTEKNISKDIWLHTDNTKLGGVVYLNNVYPEHPENHGTMVIINNEQVIIPYEYNKLVLYPSNYIHKPMNGFGNSLDSSRLTLNFFIR
jgi:hypothetical protein